MKKAVIDTLSIAIAVGTLVYMFPAVFNGRNLRHVLIRVLRGIELQAQYARDLLLDKD